MQTVEATVPCLTPPAWAMWERALFAAMDEAVHPFLDKYTHPDGTLIFRETWPNGRDGADDLYESVWNWPLLYLLGGGDHLLALAHHEWDAITRQLTALGPVAREYERGYDQFHQSEGYVLFYFLCLADPPTRRCATGRGGSPAFIPATTLPRRTTTLYTGSSARRTTAVRGHASACTTASRCTRGRRAWRATVCRTTTCPV